jgi:hypothetical protein
MRSPAAVNSGLGLGDVDFTRGIKEGGVGGMGDGDRDLGAEAGGEIVTRGGEIATGGGVGTGGGGDMGDSLYGETARTAGDALMIDEGPAVGSTSWPCWLSTFFEKIF